MVSHTAFRRALALGSTLVIVSVTALGLFAGAQQAFGFGSTEMLGQNSEHQHITESLQQSDPLWNSKSLQLVAGSSYNYGAVAAADRSNDSSATPLKGLGPGYKHCDDGDWLDIAGYAQSREKARAELEQCARYYQYLLDRAVRYAGQLVTPELQVNSSVFNMTSRAGSFAADSACNYRFSLTPDSNAKCDVINAFGRALHVAEDVWSHSNWADYANPALPISYKNPPGLGNTTIPGFLRYPSAATIPDGLISGCDDSVPLSGCSGRVGHSALAKDNGTFNSNGSNASSTSKYDRGLVTVNGVTNFQRAITGAMSQVASTWSDLQSAINSKYGAQRGALIASVLRSDAPSVPALAGYAMIDAPPAMVQGSLDAGEFAADPANDAKMGSYNKATDPGHSGLDHGDTEGVTRSASGEEVDAATSSARTSETVAWWIGSSIVVVAAGAIITFVVIRRRKAKATNQPQA